MQIDTPLEKIKGVGPEAIKKLHILGLKTLEDLINYYPRRYDDFSKLIPIARLRPGVVTVQATIKQAKGRYVRRGMHITEAIASDNSGSVRLVWFNQPYRARQFKDGAQYYISGEYQLSYRRFSIMNPACELVGDFPVNTARIVPVYRETKGFKSSQIRKILRQALGSIQGLAEDFPSWIAEDLKLMPRSETILNVHFPESAKSLEAAKRRLGFQEVFELTLAALLNKHQLSQGRSLAIKFNQKLAKDFVNSLPFKLTNDQRKVTWQIYQDIQREQPMNRLLEGDVGSGKTVVALMAALMAVSQEFQVVLMAPTEILARQHSDAIYSLLEPLGLHAHAGLLVGSMTTSQKQSAHKSIKNGKIKLIVGTHALIAEKVDMHKLGLIIVDEQHRFGVEERKKLQSKAGHAVHVLHMTATPIPRSLALTLYGDLDISVLSQKPVGRQPIATKLVSPNSNKDTFIEVKKELNAGRQAYVVCPLINPLDTLPAKSAQQVFDQLSKKELKGYKIGLLHGKLKTSQKEKIMNDFVAGKLQVLVSTTVIEVGVDVPNASIMIIESPERFGLAQIHQLRGRVGRGSEQSHCFLMLSDSSAPSRRLRALEQSSDGFKLAELDLELRGPGAIYGRLQHGVLDLTFTKLTDTKAIAAARHTAQKFIDKGDNLLKYPELNKRVQNLRAITNLN